MTYYVEEVGADMLEKLTEVVKVETFLRRVKCPNPSRSCNGYIAHDGKTRTKDGMHGGPLQYRHICDSCGAGMWLDAAYPKVEYRVVPEVQQLPVSKKPVKATGENVVRPTEESAG